MKTSKYYVFANTGKEAIATAIEKGTVDSLDLSLIPCKDFRNEGASTVITVIYKKFEEEGKRNIFAKEFSKILKPFVEVQDYKGLLALASCGELTDEAEEIICRFDAIRVAAAKILQEKQKEITEDTEFSVECGGVILTFKKFNFTFELNGVEYYTHWINNGEFGKAHSW